MPLILDDDDKTKIKGRTGRSVGRPRKSDAERLRDFPTFKVRPETLEWYATRAGYGARSTLARAAVEAMSLLEDCQIKQFEGIAYRRDITLGEALAWWIDKNRAEE
jgi:hypothetical protein